MSDSKTKERFPSLIWFEEPETTEENDKSFGEEHGYLMEILEKIHSEKNIDFKENNSDFTLFNLICNKEKKDNNLEKEIEYSKYILNLKDNWDDEGSIEYKQRTWEKSIKFIREYFYEIKIQFNITVDIPKIYPGPNGSIDIFWKNKNYELLINVNDNNDIASYYGDDKSENTFKGTLNLSNKDFFLGLISWQMTIQKKNGILK